MKVEDRSTWDRARDGRRTRDRDIDGVPLRRVRHPAVGQAGTQAAHPLRRREHPPEEGDGRMEAL